MKTKAQYPGVSTSPSATEGMVGKRCGSRDFELVMLGAAMTFPTRTDQPHKREPVASSRRVSYATQPYPRTEKTWITLFATSRTRTVVENEHAHRKQCKTLEDTKIG